MYLFFFNVPAPSEIYTLSLHDALPILRTAQSSGQMLTQDENLVTVDLQVQYRVGDAKAYVLNIRDSNQALRSEEHTSELQSRPHLVCRLLLEKKKKKKKQKQTKERHQS